MPELDPDVVFVHDVTKPSHELAEARALGIDTTPVLLGPLTLLLRSEASRPDMDPLQLLDPLVDAYAEVLAVLKGGG